MNKIVFASSLILLCNTNYGQDCTDANVAGLPGKWKLLSGSFFNHSKIDVSKEKPIADAVIETVRKNLPWAVVGGDISYESCGLHDDPRPAAIVKISNLYSAEIYFNAYYCDAGKIKLQEGNNSLSVRFNGLPFVYGNFTTTDATATSLNEATQTDRYVILRSLPVVKDGYFDFIEDGVDGSGSNTGDIVRYRTITKQGTLPYIVMDKKEYFERSKKKHQQEIDNIKFEKATLSKDLEGNAQLPALLKQQDQYIALYQNQIDKIDEILKTISAEKLSKPAYEGEENGEYFESRQAADYLRSYIVKPNFAYYNNKLPKTSPQVITIIQHYSMYKDDNGKKSYSCEHFFNALENMNVFDLLTEKLKPLIVQ